jgi:hypothetical protein
MNDKNCLSTSQKLLTGQQISDISNTGYIK